MERCCILIITSFLILSLFDHVRVDDSPPEEGCHRFDLPTVRAMYEGNKTWFKDGDTIELNCRENYHKRLVYTACTQGYFTRPVPYCNMVACQGKSLVNGNIRFLLDRDFPLNSSVHVRCKPGFAYSGDNPRVCLRSGNWSGTAGHCIETSQVRCAQLKVEKEMKIAPKDYIGSYQEKIQITCIEGHVYTGDRERTCLVNGTWSGSGGRCEAVRCGEPKLRENATILVNSYTYGAKAVMICDSGLILAGPNYIICEADSTWTEPGSCRVRERSSNKQQYVSGHGGLIIILSIGFVLVWSSTVIFLLRKRLKKWIGSCPRSQEHHTFYEGVPSMGT